MLPLLLLAAVAFAQNAPHIRDWKPEPGEPGLSPKSRCMDLHSLTGYEFSVLTTDEIPAAGARQPFCRVWILVQPEIQVEVSLPAKWNNRLYMFGNGGYAGEKLDAPNRVAHRDAAVTSGFVVTQTNTGHDAEREPQGTFTVHPQKLADYAFRSLHVTVETAKRVAEAYYGSRPTRSYYNGCSTGGRQGLILAQRYPLDFDGIIVGAPALNNTANRIRSIATWQAQARAPIRTEKLKLLAGRVYERCDARDGLKDNLLTDPTQCDFQPSRDLPVCQGAEAADCFTAGQIQVIETIYSDVMLNGRRATFGFPKGAEVAGPNGRSGWDGWILKDDGIAQGPMYAESALKYMLKSVPDPEMTILKFNLERDAHLLDRAGRLMNATNPDLTRFRDHGGKILMYFGWADPALNPRLGIEYYDSVRQTMGAGTGDFFRLFMMPGVFHCSGGVGPACFDPLKHIVPWVEKGKAPERIVAQQLEQGRVVRTRPLCPHPQVARYRGAGSADEEKNFRCEP
ncbi:MAG: tannase/feruloyl esterase family alpha/beta hydrolase [Bryobacteraceae bacterium]|nr:tannase/feruloyl esterase family alpha/beta hydrolase [Bryobacteraceae bacterium]